MTSRSAILCMAIAMVALVSLSGQSELTVKPNSPSTENTHMQHAHGTFSVKVVPVDPPMVPGTGRFTIDKTLKGDMAGTSKGEMYTAGDFKTGEAGYVAIEVVTGKLGGKEGSFALLHTATLEGGKPSMTVRVAPGSGTGALKGITGVFTITQAAGLHSYDLEYTLP